MATTIRLKRVGRKKQSTFRIVVTDSREGPNAPSIERLGLYNPRTRPSLIRLDVRRTLHWLHEGARPSDSVRSLLRKAGVWEQWTSGVAPDTVEEPVVVIGPPAGERKTSRRPAPGDGAEAPARGPRAGKAESAAGAGAAGADEIAEAGAAAAEAEAEAPEASVEAAEAPGETAEAPDVAQREAAGEEAPEAAEEEAPEASEEEGPAAEAEGPASAAEAEKEEAGEADEAEEEKE